MANDITKQEKKPAEIPTLALTAKELKKILKEEQARRETLRAYIKLNFHEGTHFSRTCRRNGKPHYLDPGEPILKGDTSGKMELLQDGAQTAIDVMKCSYVDYPDKEMIEVLGEKAVGVIILRGVITSQDGKTVKGYGRGACSLAEKNGSTNNAIKQAQIRCMRNAVINSFALSDLYTQDVDDVNAQDLAKKIDDQKDEKDSMMKKYIEKIFEVSKVTPNERKKIELIFDNGIEMYKVLRFVNEITDPDTIALIGTL